MSLEKYRWDLINCERCSMCKWVHPWSVKSKARARICPSMQKYKYDAYSAQGRFDLARALLEHELRKYAVEQGKGPLPGHLPAVDSIRKNNNPWLQPSSRRGHWARKLKVKNLNKEKAEVLYFAGCTYSYNANLQKVAQSTLRIMQDAGVDVGILGNGEGCCASPVLKAGITDLFGEIASRNIKAFNELGVKKVVTSCAGCYGIFQSQYPAAGKMNFEVMHSVQFLDQLLQAGRLKFTTRIPLKVTWHDPCHLGRGGEKQDIWEGVRVKWGLSDPPRQRNYGANGVFDAPRNILKALPGVELVEMERIREFSWCCGAGGGVRAAFPDFALETAQERVEEAKATGAEALVTSCPWCESNLNDAITADGNKIQLFSLVELIEKAL
ncbi:MAG: heterodisulfide reductase-related iron-sulfur binding cluster [Proteobacteria bacterium]|nr:heterodisulfide reductase-related iron-sulfur binding cluster [Pseudomonadota bacterium]